MKELKHFCGGKVFIALQRFNWTMKELKLIEPKEDIKKRLGFNWTMKELKQVWLEDYDILTEVLIGP